MANLGFTLGGVAEGAKTAADIRQADEALGIKRDTLAQDTALRTRALDLTQSAQANQQNRELLARADSQINDTMTVIGETIKAGLEAGKDPIVLRRAVTPLLESAQRLAKGSGRDPMMLTNRVDALLVQPTGTETAAASGRAKATSAIAEAKTYEAAGAEAPSPYKDINQRTQAENSLRDDFTKASKNYVTMVEAKNRLDNLNQSGAGDMALVFQFMKILDPGSTVREGEYATAANSGGVPQAIQALYNKAIGGGSIGEETRKQILSQANRMYQAAAVQHDKLQTQYRNIAVRQKLNPDNVIVNFLPAGGDAAPAQSGAIPPPPKGAVLVQ